MNVREAENRWNVQVIIVNPTLVPRYTENTSIISSVPKFGNAKKKIKSCDFFLICDKFKFTLYTSYSYDLVVQLQNIIDRVNTARV